MWTHNLPKHDKHHQIILSNAVSFQQLFTGVICLSLSLSDYSKGFGGKYGVQKDRMDKVHYWISLTVLTWSLEQWHMGTADDDDVCVCVIRAQAHSRRWRSQACRIRGLDLSKQVRITFMCVYMLTGDVTHISDCASFSWQRDRQH